MIYILWLTGSFVAVAIFTLKYFHYFAISRSEVNCHNCGYPEHPHKSPYDIEVPCSECGLTWCAAEKCNDTRRRLCAFAVLISLGVMNWSLVAAHRHTSLFTFIPSWVIVRIAPTQPLDGWRYSDTPLPRLLDEIATRGANGELDANAQSVFAKRVFRRLDRDDILVPSRQVWLHDPPVRVRIADCVHFSMLGNITFRVLTADEHVLLERHCWRWPNRRYLDPFDRMEVPAEMIRDGTLPLRIEIRDATGDDALLAEYTVEVLTEYGRGME